MLRQNSSQPGISGVLLIAPTVTKMSAKKYTALLGKIDGAASLTESCDIGRSAKENNQIGGAKTAPPKV